VPVCVPVVCVALVDAVVSVSLPHAAPITIANANMVELSCASCRMMKSPFIGK